MLDVFFEDLLKNTFDVYVVLLLLTIPMMLFFRYHKAKTKFLCNPEKGVIELEQKLPFSWHAFNETPKYEVIFIPIIINTL